MARLTIYPDNHVDSTVVSNLFIDEYMKDANDAQLKVYLYLLRMMSAHLATSVSDIADRFNHTEKDVLRALRYWEKQQLLSLDYDGDKNLVGIHIHDLTDGARAGAQMPASFVPMPVMSAAEDVRRDAVPAGLPQAESQPDSAQAAMVYAKPSYTADQLREFKGRQETTQLLFIAESYIGKPLTPSEIKTILYFTDVLRFSDDLIDYLESILRGQGQEGFQIHRESSGKLGGGRHHHPEAGPEKGHPLRQEYLHHHERPGQEQFPHRQGDGVHHPLAEGLRLYHGHHHRGL